MAFSAFGAPAPILDVVLAIATLLRSALKTNGTRGWIYAGLPL